MQQRRTYAMIRGLPAVAVAMVYWNFALVAAPDGVLGVHSLGNIKCYAVLVILMVIFFLGFYLPLKIFGCSSATVAAILGILAAIVYILCMTSFCMVVKNTVLQTTVTCIAGIAGLNPVLGSIYWQCYPHPLVFPTITIFMITFISRWRQVPMLSFWE